MERHGSRRFNAQARKIEELRQEIERTTETYEAILAYGAKKLFPLGPKIAAGIEEIAFAVDAKASSYKFGVRQREMVGFLIIDLLGNAFSLVPPTPKARELFDRWNEVSLAEEEERQEAGEIERMGEILKENFGVEIDEETLRQGPEATEAALREALEEARLAEAAGYFPGNGGRRRAPTKKQLEREALAQAQAALKRKTLRSLYLSLAKILHPDAEQDATVRAEKEAVMKEVTVAHEAGDLHSLLRIEMDWIARESSHLSSIGKDTLEVYLQALKAQARDLRRELEDLKESPRYQILSQFLSPDLAWSTARIDAAARKEKKHIKELEAIKQQFLGQMDKQDFLARVRAQLVD